MDLKYLLKRGTYWQKKKELFGSQWVTWPGHIFVKKINIKSWGNVRVVPLLFPWLFPIGFGSVVLHMAKETDADQNP